MKINDGFYVYKQDLRFFFVHIFDNKLKYYDSIDKNSLWKGLQIKLKYLENLYDGYIMQCNIRKKRFFLAKHNCSHSKLYKNRVYTCQIMKRSFDKLPEVSTYIRESNQHNIIKNHPWNWINHFQPLSEIKELYTNIKIPTQLNHIKKINKVPFQKLKVLTDKYEYQHKIHQIGDGSYIILEHTSANISIDINRGSSKNSCLDINLMAWDVIKTLMKIYNLHGIILIDWLKSLKHDKLALCIDEDLEVAVNNYAWVFLPKMQLSIITRQFSSGGNSLQII